MADSKRSVYTAIITEGSIAVAKFVAAGFSGSSSMLTEGIHSVVDTGITALMLVGILRSRKKPDHDHPFGYGTEVYYWSNVVSLLLFSIGGGMGALEGLRRLIDPGEEEASYWNYGVLAVSAVFGTYSFWVAHRQTRERHPEGSLWSAVVRSKDPSNFSVMLIDLADLIGVGLAFLGLLIGQLFHSPYPDAVAAILISLVLSGVAVILANESRHLLLGESVDQQTVVSIRRIAEADQAVEHAPHPFTMHLGPDEVLLALDVQFREGLSAQQISLAVERIERSIRTRHPEIKRIFLEARYLGESAPPRQTHPAAQRQSTSAPA